MSEDQSISEDYIILLASRSDEFSITAGHHNAIIRVQSRKRTVDTVDMGFFDGSSKEVVSEVRTELILSVTIITSKFDQTFVDMTPGMAANMLNQYASWSAEPEMPKKKRDIPRSINQLTGSW